MQSPQDFDMALIISTLLVELSKIRSFTLSIVMGSATEILVTPTTN
jgi:hypothetical protein